MKKYKILDVILITIDYYLIMFFFKMVIFILLLFSDNNFYESNINPETLDVTRLSYQLLCMLIIPVFLGIASLFLVKFKMRKTNLFILFIFSLILYFIFDLRDNLFIIHNHRLKAYISLLITVLLFVSSGILSKRKER